jgi:hypothetical protein
VDKTTLSSLTAASLPRISVVATSQQAADTFPEYLDEQQCDFGRIRGTIQWTAHPNIEEVARCLWGHKYTSSLPQQDNDDGDGVVVVLSKYVNAAARLLMDNEFV